MFRAPRTAPSAWSSRRRRPTHPGSGPGHGGEGGALTGIGYPALVAVPNEDSIGETGWRLPRSSQPRFTAGCAAPSGVAAARRSPSVTTAPRPCVSGQLTSSGAGVFSGPILAEADHAAGLVGVSDLSSLTCDLSISLQIEIALKGRHIRLTATPDPAVEKDIGLRSSKRIGFKITWPTSRVYGHCVSGARLDVTVPQAKP
jgi:hypothetical protein